MPNPDAAKEQSPLEKITCGISDLSKQIFGSALAIFRRPPQPEDELRSVITNMVQAEEREIGAKFKEIVGSLPNKFQRWEQWFIDVPKVSKGIETRIQQELDVIEGGPHAQTLAKYAITPSMFFQITHGLELLADRVLQYSLTQPELYAGHADQERLAKWLARQHENKQPLSVDLRHPWNFSATNNPPALPPQLLLAQTRTWSSETFPQAAEPLLRWIIEAAALRPDLFQDHRVAPIEGGIRLYFAK